MNPNTSSEQTFDQAYWAHQPPQVAALQNVQVDVEAPKPGGRTYTAEALASQGFIIDENIMVWGWDAYLVMLDRQQNGFTWVPNALQPNLAIAPGITQPSTPPYDPKNPPPGSIKVSTNIADYPPYQVPGTPAPVAPKSPVGAQVMAGGTLYYVAYGDTTPIGAIVRSDPRGVFAKVALPVESPFALSGFTPYYQLVQTQSSS